MFPLTDGPAGRAAVVPAPQDRPWRERQRTAGGAQARRWGLIVGLCAVYAVAVLLWQVLRFTPLAEWWLFELLDIFGLALFAPLPLLVVVALLGGSRAAGLWLLAPVALLAWEYGGLFLPQVPPSGEPLRVLTANLLVVNGQHARVAAMIRMEAPDVVALQELSPGMADHLARSLRNVYPHQLLVPDSAPFGLGILSRYPLQPESDVDIRACECQRVIIDVEGRAVRFVNVHPPPPMVSLGQLGRLPIPAAFDPTQTNARLLSAIDGVDPGAGPLLVAGDFNVSDRQPMYRRLRRDLLDAHREAGWGLGYSFPARSFAGFPELGLIRIDYILHSQAVGARAVNTGPTPGSDHHHVIADLVLR